MNNHAGLNWAIADLLRGDYKQSEYGRVILPLVVLRRLDCVLEPTKSRVIAHLADLRGVAARDPAVQALLGLAHITPLVLVCQAHHGKGAMIEQPRNPYRPGVGQRPTVMAGRDGELRRFAATLRSAPEIPANVRIEGLRGVGKSVLLAEFREIAGRQNWATSLLELEPRHNTDDAILSVLAGQADTAARHMSATARTRHALGVVAGALRAVGFEMGDVTARLDPTLALLPGQVELTGRLLAAVNAALGADKHGYLLFLDEAQVLNDEIERTGEHPLSLLVAAVSAIQKTGAPLGLILCGLPTLSANLLRARTYTERMFRGERIESLDRDGARLAFVGPLDETGVVATDALTDLVLNTVEGYPYFIQLWGAELWEAARDAGVSEFSPTLLAGIEPEIYRRLDIDFYDPRVEVLRPSEQDLLLSAALCRYPPLIVADLQAVANKSAANVNVLLGRMANAGVIYRLRKGQYGYTAPGFADYLRRRTDRLRRQQDTRP